ncbi:hypothetical protein OKA04_22745 [Luteolibacter flavescens]|uniref:DUF4012 domain-containing protein n=1 Tax=Luteolibacter flavescens TaxID=1859460 RepID=A0ABT3FVI0_9BACT|nr:hypothetical protein [Luteolibacter flavescens]MCW1887573.1 hypothetical protein [Luteolibacter flavescens]
MKSWAAVLTLAWTSVAAAAEGPGDAALSFLRSLKKGNAVFAVGDTAVSPDVPEEEKADIAEKLNKLGRQIRPDDLRVIEEKQDGDLAAVLISQVTNYDASSVQIHAVGLVRSADKWKPAPLPSSFDSTGLSFRPGFLARARQLEDWMLSARGEQFVKLKDNIFTMLADEMRKVKSLDDLHESTPEKLANDFLKALAERNLPAALAIAGGLEDPRPADWEDTFQAISRTLRSPKITHQKWRLLAAPEVLRAIVHVDSDGDDRLASLVVLDPGDYSTRPRPKMVHLPFLRSKAGLWRVRLPQEFLAAATQRPGQDEEDDGFDADLLAKFPAKLAERYPAVNEPDARAAAKAVLASLREVTLDPLIPRLDLTSNPEAALDALGRAARLWQRFHQTDDLASPVILDVHESGDDAVALVQLVSGKSPETARIETLFLRRGEGGWRANPGLSGPGALAQVKDATEISKWIADASKARNEDWANGLVQSIGGIAADTAPSEEDARRIVEEWRKAISSGDAATMLDRSACFDDKEGRSKLLRNSGYELLSRQQGEILGVNRAGRWAVVSVRIPPAAGDDSADAYAMHVVATTPAGPRVLAELDFFDPLTRSREFLNRRLWERVAARLPDGARGELESIYEKHRTISAADRERRLNPTE